MGISLNISCLRKVYDSLEIDLVLNDSFCPCWLPCDNAGFLLPREALDSELYASTARF